MLASFVRTETLILLGVVFLLAAVPGLLGLIRGINGALVMYKLSACFIAFLFILACWAHFSCSYYEWIGGDCEAGDTALFSLYGLSLLPPFLISTIAWIFAAKLFKSRFSPSRN